MGGRESSCRDLDQQTGKWIKLDGGTQGSHAALLGRAAALQRQLVRF